MCVLIVKSLARIIRICMQYSRSRLFVYTLSKTIIEIVEDLVFEQLPSASQLPPRTPGVLLYPLAGRLVVRNLFLSTSWPTFSFHSTIEQNLNTEKTL